MGLALVIAAAVACLFFCLIVLFEPHRWSREDFEAKYPPINDEEFIRRCSPGVSRNVALGVRRIVSESLDINYEQIYPEQRFVEDLGAD